MRAFERKLSPRSCILLTAKQIKGVQRTLNNAKSLFWEVSDTLPNYRVIFYRRIPNPDKPEQND